MQRRYTGNATDPDQWQAAEDEGEMFTSEEQEAMDMAIMAISENILSTRAEAVQWRASCGIERWWRICESLLDYASELPMTNMMMDYVTGNVPIDDSDQHRSKVIMNVTRGRTEVARGRMADILLPVYEKNWGFDNTPVIETAEMKGNTAIAAGPDGQPIMKGEGEEQVPATMDDIYRELKKRAGKAMEGMERVCDDQLTECHYSAQIRKLLDSSVNVGTGIIKGPYVSKKLQRVWKKVPSKKNPGKFIRVLNYKEDTKPICTQESVWNVFPSPDCGDDIQKASYVWHLDTMRPKDVRKLIGLPGYSKRQLQLVLSETPRRLNIVNNQRGNAFSLTMEQLNLGNQYEVWEYNGEVRPEWLQILGCNCADSEVPVSGRVVFINDHPVKASLNILDTGDLPFHFFAWDPIEGQPWGAGEPLKIMWPQRIINAAWRQMMDNAGDSSGVNLAILGLVPDDDEWEATGRKLWRWDGVTPLTDVRQAITQFQAQNNQADIANILDLALRFIDLMTATPTIFQGEGKEQPDTLGQTNIIVDSSNVTYRAKVSRFDSSVTVPLLTMWYDYNMQYHPDDNIKVDLSVAPRGASILFEKDQVQQKLLQVFAMKQIPVVDENTDWRKAMEQFYSANHLDIIKDKADVENDAQNKPQQVDPAQAAQADAKIVAQIRVDGELKKAQMTNEAALEEAKIKAADADKERQTKIQLKQMDYNMKMMEYSMKRGINLDDLKVQLAISAKGYEAKAKAGEMIGAGKLSPQVAKEGTEPPEHAPDGEAFPK
jgi:hypothetical protein